jgi:hypothetical protein
MSLRCVRSFTFQRSQHLGWKYIHLATDLSRFTRPNPYQHIVSVSAIAWPQASQTGSSPTSF